MAKTGSKASLVSSANRYKKHESESYHEFRAVASATPSQQVDLTQHGAQGESDLVAPNALADSLAHV